MNALKPCPFCGESSRVEINTYTEQIVCGQCGAVVYYKYWDTRPIEDDLRNSIAELEESDKHWAGNVKVCMQLIERYESDIAELEEIDRMRSESVSTLNQANANNEDEIELLEKRIAKLKAKNETLKTACDILRKQNQRLFSQVFSDGKPELNACKACGGDGTVLLTDGYEGQVIATAECIYCNGTGHVNKEQK